MLQSDNQGEKEKERQEKQEQAKGVSEAREKGIRRSGCLKRGGEKREKREKI